MKSVAVSECHYTFLVMITKMYSNSHYLPEQILPPFHQVFLYGACELWCHVKIITLGCAWKFISPFIAGLKATQVPW